LNKGNNGIWKIYLTLYEEKEYYNVNVALISPKNINEVLLKLTPDVRELEVKHPWSVNRIDNEKVVLKSPVRANRVELSYYLKLKDKLLPQDHWYPRPINTKYIYFEVEATCNAPSTVIVNGLDFNIRAWGREISSYWKGYGKDIVLIKVEKPLIHKSDNIVFISKELDKYIPYSIISELSAILSKLSKMMPVTYSKVLLLQGEGSLIDYPPLMSFKYSLSSIHHLYLKLIATALGLDVNTLNIHVVNDICNYILYKLRVYGYLARNVFKTLERFVGEEKVKEIISKNLNDIDDLINEVNSLLGTSRINTYPITRITLYKDSIEIIGNGVYEVKLIDDSGNIRLKHVLSLKADTITRIGRENNIKLIIVKPI